MDEVLDLWNYYEASSRRIHEDIYNRNISGKDNFKSLFTDHKINNQDIFSGDIIYELYLDIAVNDLERELEDHKLYRAPILSLEELQMMTFFMEVMGMIDFMGMMVTTLFMGELGMTSFMEMMGMTLFGERG